MLQVVRKEPTPNPNAFKYHMSEALVEKGALHFSNPREAVDVPLARHLLEDGSVSSVYIQDNFVTISANQWADWGYLEDLLREELGGFDRTKTSGIAAAAEERRAAADAEITDELLIKANQLIDRYVRPALAGDGGGLEVVGIEDKTISVRYQGACGSCPSATAQTLRAIENLLRTQLDPEITLVSA
jgi:Fe-S cluster biogenesis protein NfuA